MTRDFNQFAQILKDSRDLLREDEIEETQQSIENLKEQCLEDPMMLYPRNSYKPRFVVWELTLRCNMRCRHCGSDAGAKRNVELSPEEALDLCDQLGGLKCERLTLLGGEPFLRRDWEALTKRLQDNGVRVNVITNGWVTGDKDFVKRIRDAGLTTFAISIDGYKEGHDELRRMPGSWDRIMKSYDNANQLGDLHLAAVTTLTKLSIPALNDIYETLIDKGVRLWQMQLVTPQGRMEPDDPIIPSAEDLKTVANFIIEKKAEGKVRIDPADNVGYYGPWELDHGFRSSITGHVCFWNGCQAGCQVMGIEADGGIKGCLSQPSEPAFYAGNVREESLEKIWWKPGAFAYNREFTFDMLEGYCAKCDYRGLCRAGCTSHAYCKSGSRGNNPDCLHRLIQEGKITLD